MNIMALLDYLQNEIENAKRMPLMNQYVFDRDKCLDLLQDIRNTLPEEIMEAEKINSERNHILYDAEKDAETIIEEAELQFKRMVEESDVTQAAYAKADQVIASAEKSSNEIQNSANAYVEDVLSDLESYIQRNLDIIRQNRDQMRGR